MAINAGHGNVAPNPFNFVNSPLTLQWISLWMNLKSR